MRNPGTGGSDSDTVEAERLGWEAERVIAPAKPGKAGGGRGPHGKSVSEEAQVG